MLQACTLIQQVKSQPERAYSTRTHTHTHTQQIHIDTCQHLHRTTYGVFTCISLVGSACLSSSTSSGMLVTESERGRSSGGCSTFSGMFVQSGALYITFVQIEQSLMPMISLLVKELIILSQNNQELSFKFRDLIRQLQQW